MFNKSKKIEIKAEEVLWNKNIRLHNRKSDMNKKNIFRHDCSSVQEKSIALNSSMNKWFMLLE